MRLILFLYAACNFFMWIRGAIAFGQQRGVGTRHGRRAWHLVSALRAARGGRCRQGSQPQGGRQDHQQQR